MKFLLLLVENSKFCSNYPNIGELYFYVRFFLVDIEYNIKLKKIGHVYILLLWWNHTDLVVTSFKTFLFFENVGKIPSFWGKRTKKDKHFGEFLRISENFGSFRQTSDVFGDFRLQFSHN